MKDHETFIDALMNMRPHNAPSGMGVGRLSTKGHKSGKSRTKVAPKHKHTKRPGKPMAFHPRGTRAV